MLARRKVEGAIKFQGKANVNYLQVCKKIKKKKLGRRLLFYFSSKDEFEKDNTSRRKELQYRPLQG